MTSYVEQGTEQWFAERLGKVTASRVADIIATTKTGWSASRERYKAKLVVERLTNQTSDEYENDAMRWGIEYEDWARTEYEFLRDIPVEVVGFVPHPKIPESGASPDGLVGSEGLIEIKCPQAHTHMNTLLGSAIPGNHQTQMQWQMACTNRQWCDYVSYSPLYPQNMRLHIRRVERDENTIRKLEEQVQEFLGELNATVNALRSRYG